MGAVGAGLGAGYCALQDQPQLAFLHGWVEIPKCDNHRLGLFVTSDVRDGAGCRLTVHRLDAVDLGGEPIVHLFFKSRKSSRTRSWKIA